MPVARTFALVLALLLGLAVAQTVQTGTLHVELDGVPKAFQTTGTKIAENAAEGVANEAARAFLEKLAGTWVHSATFKVLEPMILGGIVLFAASDMFVSIDSYASDDPESRAQIDLRFGLDLETLLLSDDADIEVRYYLTGYSTSDSYLLTDGGLVVESVVQVDDTTLSVRGTFSGTLSRQLDRMNEAHNPADTIALDGRFDIHQLVRDTRVVSVLVDATD